MLYNKSEFNMLHQHFNKDIKYDKVINITFTKKFSQEFF